MPRLCVEFKHANGGNMTNAEQQAAYYGVVMVNTAWAQHKFMGKHLQAFLGIT
jgi:hypothetical protein